MANVIDDGFAPVHEINDWDFPLWSEILPGLWTGGTDDYDTIDYVADTKQPRNITQDDFDTVVTLYAWARPADWRRARKTARRAPRRAESGHASPEKPERPGGCAETGADGPENCSGGTHGSSPGSGPLP